MLSSVKAQHGEGTLGLQESQHKTVRACGGDGDARTCEQVIAMFLT